MVYNSTRYIVDFGGTELLICYFIVRPIKSVLVRDQIGSEVKIIMPYARTVPGLSKQSI